MVIEICVETSDWQVYIYDTNDVYDKTFSSFKEHLLLQFGQIRVGACLVAPALVFDQAPAGHDQRELLADVAVLLLQ